MAKSYRFRTQAQIDRQAGTAEHRRRDLKAAHPELDPRCWSALALGHSSMGVKAIRAWLRSVDAMTKALSAPI